jgi:hypothetical protein
MTERSETRKEFGFWIQVLIAASVSSIFEYARRQFTREYEFATPLLIASGYGEVPYQYRFLVAWTSLNITESFPFLSFDACLFIADACAAMVTIWSSKIILERSGFSNWVSFGLSILVTLPLALCFFISPKTTYPLYYPYDFPAVAFFTVGLLLLFTKRQFAFECLFVIGTLNRESILFLLFPYLRIFVLRDAVRLQHYTRAFLLLSAWAIIKLLMYYSYSTNPGRPLHFALLKNCEWLLEDYNILYVLTLAGGLWLPMLIFKHHTPSSIKDLLACVLPFSLITIMVGGIGEQRVFLEITPLLWISLVVGIKSFIVELKQRNLNTR